MNKPGLLGLTPIVPLLIFAACADEPLLADVEAELDAPSPIAVPDGNALLASYRAFGFQVYECQPDAAGALAWKLRAPVAMLVADDDALVAVHVGGIDVGLAAGPYWMSTLDGSRVHGGNAVAAPNPGAIPLLRLSALDHDGQGLFAGVTYIQRLATTGGLAPTSKCRKTSPRAYVPYTAEYAFWGASIPRPAVPETITVDEGHEVAFVGHATGAQIYECAADATWKLRAPRAVLTDDADDTPFVDHFGGIDAELPAGPYWRSLRDGSRVHAGNAISSPNPGTIALLRLQVLDSAGNGILSRVSFLQRLATSGGVAPAGPCAAGERREVPYTADYYFYVPAVR